MSSTRSAGRKVLATEPAWRTAGLILCTHGLRTGMGEAARHARAIRRRGLFADVRVGRLRGDPTLADVVAHVHATPVYVVPFLMAEGYIANTLLPRALAEAGATGRRLIPCRPLGAHSGLADVIAARAGRECLQKGWPVENTALLVIGHGTPRDPASGESAYRLASRISTDHDFAQVAAAFLEQEPGVRDRLDRLAAPRCVAVGLFADRGPHGIDDVQEQLARAGDRVAYAGPIGDDPALTDVILDQVRAADSMAAVA